MADKKTLVVLYPFRSIATWVATAVPTEQAIFKAYTNDLDQVSIVYTGSAIGVHSKERINRTRITRTGADHRG
jgi:hypothetical protein